jgi:hypothetical protein
LALGFNLGVLMEFKPLGAEGPFGSVCARTPFRVRAFRFALL